MMMQFNKTALASALALALTACGGGGGSDGGGGNDDTVTISGTASKGIISRADILINGEPTGVITGTDGSYTVPIPTGAPRHSRHWAPRSQTSRNTLQPSSSA